MAFRPNQLKYSNDGIPILGAQQVEDIATEVLTKHCPNVLKSPAMTPVLEIILSMGKTTGLKSAIADLGSKGRAKILGKINFPQKLLLLDTVLTGDRHVQMRFTAAHEVGHWVIHRWNYKNWKFQTGTAVQDGLEDNEETLCRLAERTPQDWLEWQANVFAASLVMPRATFQRALVETQLAFDITRNVGTVWVSDADYSRKDFKLVGNRLANIYGVSLTSIRVRLAALKLLRDQTAAAARSAEQILSSKAARDT